MRTEESRRELTERKQVQSHREACPCVARALTPPSGGTSTVLLGSPGADLAVLGPWGTHTVAERAHNALQLKKTHANTQNTS